MKKYQERSCDFCSNTYTPTGANSRFCSRKCKGKDRWSRERKRREEEGIPIHTCGGNYGRTGADHWAYTTGIGVFKKKLSREVKDEVRYCERCSLDLSNAKPGEWAVHHRDHDRTHNDRVNLELLWNRCHQLEHDCSSNLK